MPIDKLNFVNYWKGIFMSQSQTKFMFPGMVQDNERYFPNFRERNVTSK